MASGCGCAGGFGVIAYSVSAHSPQCVPPSTRIGDKEEGEEGGQAQTRTHRSRLGASLQPRAPFSVKCICSLVMCSASFQKH